MAEDGAFYAIKRVNMAEADQETVRSYQEEIKLLTRLQKYSCIIGLVDHEYVPGAEFMFIVLEFGEIDLARILAKYPVKKKSKKEGNEKKKQNKNRSFVFVFERNKKTKHIETEKKKKTTE